MKLPGNQSSDSVAQIIRAQAKLRNLLKEIWVAPDYEPGNPVAIMGLRIEGADSGNISSQRQAKLDSEKVLTLATRASSRRLYSEAEYRGTAA